MVSGQLPPHLGKLLPVMVGVKVSFRDGATRQLPPREIAPRLALGFRLGLVLGLGDNIFSGAIVLEPFLTYFVVSECLYTNCSHISKSKRCINMKTSRFPD